MVGPTKLQEAIQTSTHQLTPLGQRWKCPQRDQICTKGGLLSFAATECQRVRKPMESRDQVAEVPHTRRVMGKFRDSSRS